MSVYCVGTPVVSALVTLKVEGEDKTYELKAGDALTNLTLENYPEDIVIESATVRGFTLKTTQAPLVGNGKVFDCIPTYKFDPQAGHNHGIVEQVSQIDKVLIELPPEGEAEVGPKEFIILSQVKAFEGGTEVGSD